MARSASGAILHPGNQYSIQKKIYANGKKKKGGKKMEINKFNELKPSYFEFDDECKIRFIAGVMKAKDFKVRNTKIAK